MYHMVSDVVEGQCVTRYLGDPDELVSAVETAWDWSQEYETGVMGQLDETYT